MGSERESQKMWVDFRRVCMGREKENLLITKLFIDGVFIPKISAPRVGMTFTKNSANWRALMPFFLKLTDLDNSEWG